MPDFDGPILVVDDDEVKRYAVCRTLRHAGFATAEAATGAEGLARAATGPALVILDVKLPDFDGYEVCRRLRADPATAAIPVLHLSSTFVGPESKVQGLENGADAYLTDASEPPVLIATVRALLRVRRAEAALREADRAKDEFLAVLAHELRNPLAPLRTGLAILQEGQASPEVVVQAQAMMARQLAHMVRLIDDLLDVGRITRDRIELRRERVSVSGVLDAAVEISQPHIAAGRHEFAQSRPPADLFLDADPARLAQAVSNLLNNAARYTPDGGHVWLTAESAAAGRELVIRVRDDGTGIAPDLLPRVWGLFTRSDTTHGRDKGGLGIGLALVKRLVELHGGSVQAHSDGPGQGSEFVVVLPTATTPAPAPDPTGNAAAAPSGSGRRALVVDDNVDGATTLALYLEHCGHTVRTADDGLAAVAAADQFRPEVVVLDIGLPGLDGYEVARRLRRQPSTENVFLIALTGWGQPADRDRSRAAGFDLHVVKPVEPSELNRMISAASRLS